MSNMQDKNQNQTKQGQNNNNFKDPQKASEAGKQSHKNDSARDGNR